MVASKLRIVIEYTNKQNEASVGDVRSHYTSGEMRGKKEEPAQSHGGSE